MYDTAGALIIQDWYLTSFSYNSQLSINIKLSDSDTWALDLELCDTIEPKETSVNFLPMKIEVKLKKKNQVKWAALERPHDPNAPVIAKWDDASGKSHKYNMPWQKYNT